MKRHNLGTVVSFEVIRTLTKIRFWVTTLIVPAAIAVVFALVAWSNAATTSSVDAQKDEEFSFSYSDASGYVDSEVVAALGGTEASDADQAISDVKTGTLDAYFSYPVDPTNDPTEVYGVDEGIFNNGKYTSVATQILVLSTQGSIGDPRLTTLLQGNIPISSTTYKDGVESGGIGAVIPPLVFLLIFYVVILLLGNQMLNATLEEKENRVTEMVLTTLNPTTLIVGKVVSLFIIGIVQMLVFVLPVVVGYLLFRDSLNLPNFDFSTLTFDPAQMVIGALLLIGGFTLFTGTLVAVGAIMPTAKEAGQIFGVLVVLIFVPFYAVSLVVSDPQSFIVQIFTYFPYSAPVTAMLRNGFGSLSILESVIVTIELFALGILVLGLAVRLFKYGSIEYTRKVSIKTALGRR